MRLYLLGIAAAALVLLTSFVLREKNRAELQLQQQNDALAAAALHLVIHQQAALGVAAVAEQQELARLGHEERKRRLVPGLGHDALDAAGRAALHGDLRDLRAQRHGLFRHQQERALRLLGQDGDQLVPGLEVQGGGAALARAVFLARGALCLLYTSDAADEL